MLTPSTHEPLLGADSFFFFPRKWLAKGKAFIDFAYNCEKMEEMKGLCIREKIHNRGT